MAEEYSFVYMDPIFSMQPFIEEHCGCLHGLAAMNAAAVTYMLGHKTSLTNLRRLKSY